MSALLDRYERQATLLRQPDEYDALDDIRELAALEAADWKRDVNRLRRRGELVGAGTQWYQDTRPPHAIADFPTITLTATSLMMWAAATFSPTVKEDWFPGKILHVRCFGKITTAVTPGNLTVEIRYGTADNAGTILATSAALTLIASQTNISWRCEFYVRCRAIGPTATSGILNASGIFECNPAVIAVGQAMIPASGPAQVTNLDLNSASGINLQLKRSGSTVETAAVTDMIFAHLN